MYMSEQRFTKSLLPLLIAVALSSGAVQPAGAAAPSRLAPGAAAQPARSAPIAATPRPQREIFGFALASSLGDPGIGYTSWNFGQLSTVAFFGLHVNDNGTLASDSGWTVWSNTSLRTAFVNAAHAGGAKVVLTIVLQDFSPGTPHMCAGLANWPATVSAAVAQVKAAGVDGLNVDYEGLNGSCGTSDTSWARHAFTSVVRSLRSALPVGSYLSVDTYASSAADPIGFFDIPSLAPTVDSFFVMAYDLEYSNWRHSPLGCSRFCLSPTAPLSGYYYNDTTTAAQYVAAAGAAKVILGVPYYGRKACVSAATPNQYPNPAGSVAADGYQDAAGEAAYYAVKPGTYAAHRDANDPAGQERWDTWYSTTYNCTRELYWDDVTSLGLKYDLVNRDGLRGVGIWTLNYGGGAPELWNSLALHFTAYPSAPGDLSACAGASSATVSWTPSASSGGPITGYRVTASPGGATVTVPATATMATVPGLAPGAAYTLEVHALNAQGAGVSAVSAAVTPVASLVSTGQFSWYDFASAGMVADNIHLLNTGAEPSSGCLHLTGQRVQPFSVPSGHESVQTLPRGFRGGPLTVTVNSGPPVRAWQREQYFQSFAEVTARPASAAATVAYFPWYDLASPGMRAEVIHVTNVGAGPASGTISLPGARTLAFTVPAGDDGYYAFPAGTIGGPVIVSSSVPVLATLRGFFYNSLSVTAARHAADAATTLYLPWYDLASAGMRADAIHLTNAGPAGASGTISLPGARPISFNVAAGHDAYFAFPYGTRGGPVTIASSQPVLAILRAWYYQSLSETWARPSSAGGTTVYFAWYDLASPGMSADAIHITNVSGATAMGTISVPGATPIRFGLPSGNDAYYLFPGVVGGPVTISSDEPVLAAQRTVFYQSLSEFGGG
jgi:hypothetical protein